MKCSINKPTELMLRNLLLTLAFSLPFLAGQAQTQQQAPAQADMYLAVQLGNRGGDNSFGGAYHDVRMRLAKTDGVLSTSYLMGDGTFLVAVRKGVDLTTLPNEIKGVTGVYRLNANDWQAKRKEFFLQKLMVNRDRKWQPTPDFPVYRNTGNAGLDEKIYTDAVLDWIETHPEQFNRLF